MKVFESVKISALFIGTIIGAGFMSGKEIAVFFRNCGVFSVLIAGVFCAFAIYIFLSLGKISEGDIVSFVFKKYSKVADLVTRISYFIVYATMLAGADEIVISTLNFPFAALILAVSSYAILKANGMKILNVICIPFLLLVTVWVFIVSDTPRINGEFKILNPILYLMMNMLLGGHTVSCFGHKLSKIQILISSVLSGVLFSLLVYFVFRCSYPFSDDSMPFISAANYVNLSAYSVVALLVAIITTMCSSLALILMKRKKAPDFLLVTALAYLLSLMGFSSLVTYLYPVVSYLGIAFFVICLAVFLNFKRKDFKLNQKKYKGENKACDSNANNKNPIPF